MCVSEARARGRPLRWAELTHPVKHDISFTLRLASSSLTPVALMEMNWGRQAEAHFLYVQITEVQADGPHYLHCCGWAHSWRNSSRALRSFQTGPYLNCKLNRWKSLLSLSHLSYSTLGNSLIRLWCFFFVKLDRCKNSRVEVWERRSKSTYR